MMLEKLKTMGTMQLLLLCLPLQLLVVWWGVSSGLTDISMSAILGMLTGNADDALTASILYELRLPRVLLALCVGMGLTLSGVIMQAIVQNPLADPYILGVSSGAYFGTAAGLFLGLGSLFGAIGIGACSFAGALFVSVLVIGFARRENGDLSNLLLGGLAMGLVFSSLAGFLVYKASDTEGMESITFWLMGSVANASLIQALVLCVVVVAIFLYFMTQSRVLNILLLGRDTAITLGVNAKDHLTKYLLCNGLLVGLIVYNAGMIGFIGLVLPHIVRSLLGADHRVLLPAAVMLGGMTAVLLDLLSRSLIPIPGVEIPLGVMFALVGAPLFIYLVFRQRYNVFM
ncbi:iron ABC transporter permease [uncultured Selenomonas sp.]|uniref:FecCD family ABC transporter permease n=1 Tax=uncultured Selenomonas sp. TaxID=159275 RepID=UPI0025CC7363|nr:iron ABC transporter permease [uncultured Selenomonas sp.]